MANWNRNQLIQQGIGLLPLGARRALHAIPGGPSLAVGAADTIYNIWKNYREISKDTAYLFDKSDVEFKDVGSASTGYEPEGSNRGRPRIPELPPPSKKVKLFSNNPAPPQNTQSQAAQGQDHPQAQPGYQRLPRPLLRIGPVNYGQQGTTVRNSNMVRRIFRRGGFRRRGRYPGTAFRRIFRSWGGQSKLRRRRGLWKPERKYYDVIHYGRGLGTGLFFGSTFQYTTANTKTLVLLNGIAQGTTAIARIGEQVTWTSVFIRGCITTPPGDISLTSYSNCVKVVLFRDRQANGSTPAITDLLEIYAGVDPALCYNALTYRNRFKVIAEKKMILIGGTNANKYYYEFVSTKPFKTTYTGSGSAVTDVRTNSLWLACIDELAVSAVDPDTSHVFHSSFNARMRFIDP